MHACIHVCTYTCGETHHGSSGWVGVFCLSQCLGGNLTGHGGWWSIPVKVMRKDDWGMGLCLCNYWSWMKLGVECNWISMRQLSYLLEHLGAWRRYMQISYHFGWLNELHLHFRRVNEPHLLVADCHICLCSLARATQKPRQNWGIPWEDMISWKNNMTCQNPRMVRCAGLHATTSSSAVPPTVGTVNLITVSSQNALHAAGLSFQSGRHVMSTGLSNLNSCGFTPLACGTQQHGCSSCKGTPAEILKRFRWFNAVKVWNGMMT